MRRAGGALGIKRVNNRQTNRRKGEEWYECQRCGFNFPRSEVIAQRGLILCLVNCRDEPGHDALAKHYPLRTEAPIPPLPEDNEDI